MFTLESQQKTLDLASFVKEVKTKVLEQTTDKNPPFNLFNFQYMFVNCYTVDTAVLAIIADLHRLKSA